MSHCAGRARLYLALNGLGAASPEAHTSPTGAQVRRISWVFRGLGRLGGGSCLLIAAPSRPPIQKGAPEGALFRVRRSRRKQARDDELPLRLRPARVEAQETVSHLRNVAEGSRAGFVTSERSRRMNEARGRPCLAVPVRNRHTRRRASAFRARPPGVCGRRGGGRRVCDPHAAQGSASDCRRHGCAHRRQGTQARKHHSLSGAERCEEHRRSVGADGSARGRQHRHRGKHARWPFRRSGVDQRNRSEPDRSASQRAQHAGRCRGGCPSRGFFPALHGRT